MKEYQFKTIAEVNEVMDFPAPEHPQFYIHTKHIDIGKKTATCLDEPVSYTNHFYAMSFKRVVSGEILYGRTKYDPSKGTMLFMAPFQTIEVRELVMSDVSRYIYIDEEFLRGSPLLEKIRKYHFFSYAVNEALHVTPREEKVIHDIFDALEIEYTNNVDEFSKDIILSHLDALLQYANRFYRRQFIHRKEMSGSVLEKFSSLLRTYSESGSFEKFGMPRLEELAGKMEMSPRYLSDSLKTESGKSALEHLHLYLVDQAKDLLLAPEKSIADVSFQLGFEYPQYFSRLFKKKEGVTPTEFRERYRQN